MVPHKSVVYFCSAVILVALATGLGICFATYFIISGSTPLYTYQHNQSTTTTPVRDGTPSGSTTDFFLPAFPAGTTTLATSYGTLTLALHTSDTNNCTEAAIITTNGSVTTTIQPAWKLCSPEDGFAVYPTSNKNTIRVAPLIASTATTTAPTAVINTATGDWVTVHTNFDTLNYQTAKHTGTLTVSKEIVCRNATHCTHTVTGFTNQLPLLTPFTTTCQGSPDAPACTPVYGLEILGSDLLFTNLYFALSDQAQHTFTLNLTDNTITATDTPRTMVIW